MNLKVVIKIICLTVFVLFIYTVSLPAIKHAPIATARLKQAASLRAGAKPSDSELKAGLQRWRSKGKNWKLHLDRETGHADFLYGDSAVPQFSPVNDVDFIKLARRFVKDSAELHGIEISSLMDHKVVKLPFSRSGSTDKVVVKFKQRVKGLRVLSGRINVLLSTNGRLLSIESTAMPAVNNISVDSRISKQQAQSAADHVFISETGLEPAKKGTPELAIAQLPFEGQRIPVLVWVIHIADSAPKFSYTYWIDAETGEMLRKKSEIHKNYVEVNVTPGTLPDTPLNTPVLRAMPDVRLTIGSETHYSNKNGSFGFEPYPYNVSLDYFGLFSRTADMYATTPVIQARDCDGTNSCYSNAFPRQFTVYDGAQTITMNNPPTEYETAAANFYHTVNKMFEWIVDINSDDFTIEGFTHEHIKYDAYVNKLDIDGDCPQGRFYRWWDPTGTFPEEWYMEFTASCKGRPNYAYSTIIAHELGHWLNERYGTENRDSGMGEGNADVWALYLFDTPFEGEGSRGPGTHSRSGENTKQFCGDSCLGCYGESHDDGEVWMGAAWKVRANLFEKYLNSGNVMADALFLGWMNAADRTTITSVIETQWLTLDDDDGDLSNGTPHYSEITRGFREQGFGVTWTDFANTGSETGELCKPHNTLAEAVNDADAGGVIRIKPGSTNEALIITKAVIIEPFSICSSTRTETCVSNSDCPQGETCESTVVIGQQ